MAKKIEDKAKIKKLSKAKKREIELEFLIQKYYELFQSIEMLPFVSSRHSEMAVLLYDAAEVRTDINESCKMTITTSEGDVELDG